MREILFRGKRVDNGEWIKGSYIKANYHWHNHGIHEDWIATNTIQNGGWCNVRIKYAVIPETVGQFTGLTDKNGKKIFEGDIICYKSRYSDPEIYCIDFDGSSFCYLSANYQYKTPVDDGEFGLLISSYEVIGNIHDNPELLKGGAE